MLPHVTHQDRIAIFQKLTPVSFSRLFRTCKWANKFIENNKRKMKIHIDKSLAFYYRLELNFSNSYYYEYEHDYKDPVDPDDVSNVLYIQSRTGDDLKEYVYDPKKLETIFSENLLQCFVLEYLEHEHSPADTDDVLEKVATVATRKLMLWGPFDAPIPKLPYNYDWLYIYNFKSHTTDRIFDLVTKHRNVTLQCDGEDAPVSDVVSRCCKLMQKIFCGNFVTDTMLIHLPVDENRPEAIDRILEERRSETVALAEGVEFYLIPVSMKSFLAVIWCSDREGLLINFGFELISCSAAFYDFCKFFFNATYKGSIIPSDEEIRNLPVVQELYVRWFK